MQPLKIRSIKLNFVLNNTRLLLNLLVPLIIFPYISRVLGPAGLGKVEYANSIVSYFVLFAALGIPTYGVREIARRRDDPAERSKVVWELTLILAGTIVLGYTAYFVLIWFIPSLYADRVLFFVIAPTIFLSCFNYEWFYTGIEDQLYITIRFIIVKLLQIGLVFLCVKKTEDFIVYAGITIGLNGLVALFNITRLKKYVHFVPFSQLNIKRHLKAVLLIFASISAVNIYVHLDVTMVGIMVGDVAVGLYTAANRIVRVIISLVTSLAMVMIPRIENCLKNRNHEGYKNYLNKSLQTILFFGVPCCFGLILLSPEIITLFAGDRYDESVLSVRLLAPIIIIGSLAYFVGLQVLYANRQEKKYTIAVSIAAMVNAAFNFLMIPIFRQNGAILGTVLAELIGLIIQIGFAWKLLKDTELFSWNTAKYFIAALIMAVAVFCVQSQIQNKYLIIVISICTGSVVYALLLILLNEKTARQIMIRYRKKI